MKTENTFKQPPIRQQNTTSFSRYYDPPGFSVSVSPLVVLSLSSSHSDDRGQRFIELFVSSKLMLTYFYLKQNNDATLSTTSLN